MTKRLTASICCVLAALLSLSASAVNEHVIAANRNAGCHVALTFDDGPHPVYTEEILSILAENHAKATFFVIGQNAEEHPDLVKAEYDAGHEIGNHTYSHPNMKKLPTDKAVEEIRRTQQIVRDIVGITPKVFRSPGGVYSDELVAAVEALGCKPVLWSWRQDTTDWKCPPVRTVVDTVLGNLQDGDIILFHDYNSKSSPTPDALRQILPELRRRGYDFVTVSELMRLHREST